MSAPCPACRTNMERAEFRGISLDVCPECAGI
ncbi:MAG: zf-TFIIB domain-containing protein, partial [Armatimonadetes bacterium]|nr:zf-TFIIB domain-containing protein [Armatimonadota bacterium]